MTATDDEEGRAVVARLYEQGFGRNGQPEDESVTGDVGPEVRPLWPPPSAPLRVAERLYRDLKHEGNRTLLCWRGNWMRWNTTHWTEIDTAELRSSAYDILGGVDYLKPIREKGVVVDEERTPWDPTKHKVADVLEAMAAVGHLSSSIDPPCWLHSAEKMPAAQMISCQNGLLDLSTRTLHRHTPTLFNVVSVPFDFDENAPKPVEWLKFLTSVWPDDPESIALLQEYIGYIVSGRLDHQKMLLLVGPTRSGKGTVARVLVALIGRGHTVGPTLASLGTNFGLSPLLGKPLAIISDARLGDTPAHTVVERLLAITGEDELTIDRKYREAWTGKLPTRFVILTNELPRFRDASAAITGRLLIAQLTRSYLGNEDRGLDKRLRAELPGILAWALKGLDRLVAEDAFTVPAASEDATNLMADLASPMSAFVRDRCERTPAASIAVDVLFWHWRIWCENNGHQAGAKSTFGRNLRAVVPEVKITNPRNMFGTPVRTYAYIGLKGSSSSSDDEPAGQGTNRGDDRTAGTPHQPDAATGPPMGGEEAPSSDKPQVKGTDEGDARTGPLRTYVESTSCRKCNTALTYQLSRKRGLCLECWTNPACR